MAPNTYLWMGLQLTSKIASVVFLRVTPTWGPSFVHFPWEQSVSQLIQFKWICILSRKCHFGVVKIHNGVNELSRWLWLNSPKTFRNLGVKNDIGSHSVNSHVHYFGPFSYVLKKTSWKIGVCMKRSTSFPLLSLLCTTKVTTEVFITTISNR